MLSYTGFCEAYHDLRNREHQKEYQQALLYTYWNLANSIGFDCTMGIPMKRILCTESSGNSRSKTLLPCEEIMERKCEAIVEAALNRTYSDGPFRLRLPAELVQLIIAAQSNRSVVARLTLVNGTPSISIVFKNNFKLRPYTATLIEGIPLSRNARWIENDSHYSKTVICEAVRCQLKTSVGNIYNTWSPTTTEYFLDPSWSQKVVESCCIALQPFVTNSIDENGDEHRLAIQGLFSRRTTHIKLGRSTQGDNLFTSLAAPIVSYYTNSWPMTECNALLLSERFLVENLSASSIEEHIKIIRLIVSVYERMNKEYDERIRTLHREILGDTRPPPAKGAAKKSLEPAKSSGSCSIESITNIFKTAMLLFVPTPMQLKLIFSTAKEVINQPDTVVLSDEDLYLAFSEQPYRISGSNSQEQSGNAYVCEDYAAIYPLRADSPFLLRERGFLVNSGRFIGTEHSTMNSSGDQKASSPRVRRPAPIPRYNDMGMYWLLPRRVQAVPSQTQTQYQSQYQTPPAEYNMFTGTFRHTASSYKEVLSILQSRKAALESTIRSSEAFSSKTTEGDYITGTAESYRSSSNTAIEQLDQCRSSAHSNHKEAAIPNVRGGVYNAGAPYFRKHTKQLPASGSVFSSIFVGTDSDGSVGTVSWNPSSQAKVPTNEAQNRDGSVSEPGRKRTLGSTSSSDFNWSSGIFNMVRVDFIQQRAKWLLDQKRMEQEKREKEERQRQHEREQELLEQVLKQHHEKLLAEQEARKEDQRRLLELEEELRQQKELLMQRQEAENQGHVVSTPMPTDRSDINIEAGSSGDTVANCRELNSHSISMVEGVPPENVQSTQSYKFIVESETTRTKQLEQLGNAKAFAKFKEFHEEVFKAERLCVISSTVYRELEAFPFAGTMKDILFTMWMGYDISKILVALFSSVRACALATPEMFESVERNTMKNVIKAPNMNVVNERNERSKLLWYDRDKEILETVLGLLQQETKHSVLELINFCSTITRCLSSGKQASAS